MLPDLIQFCQNVLRVGQDARHVGLPEPDNAFFIDHDYRASAGAPLLIPKVECNGGLALGMEVGQLRVGESAQGGRPSPVGVYLVTADAQDLGILLLEPVVILPEQGRLCGSTRGEVKHVEGKHHVGLALEAA